ncbi:MAG TPA: hypothetical protein VJ656_00645 [Pyrinomonadaceae bacterium]|nr:hypothetical protein [Pyrinomonadaceae bacterium]
MELLALVPEMTINGNPKLSRYEIRAKTAEDGMGDVYLKNGKLR